MTLLFLQLLDLYNNHSKQGNRCQRKIGNAHVAQIVLNTRDNY